MITQPLIQQNYITNLPCAGLLLDGQGVIAQANAQALQLLDNALVGRGWLGVLNQVFEPKSDDGHEISLISGERVLVLTQSLAPYPGQLILLIDLTETRHYQALQHQQARLCEIGQMTAQLAHQIRTPLASASLYLDNLFNYPDKLPDYGQKIKQCLNNIEQQIQDLLNFSRGSSTILSEINILELLAKLKNLSPKTNFITQGLDINIKAHVESLQGALLNLIENSTQAGANQISLMVEQQGNLVLFILKDNGAGIPPEKISQVTQPFFTTRAQGTGLGLAVARAFAEAHGGELSITSSPQGTKITLSIEANLP